eukprot:TRINITY_DN8960_c0_g1_i1.p1 TRINITY_DN8960_c0_g1~~TRINITY_DN8960_c0_g1_i1.p1  ORF type:complete len:824 (-),score=199.95 TRINITY_DN8960_c0_g1_i1:120-2591(-)
MVVINAAELEFKETWIEKLGEKADDYVRAINVSFDTVQEFAFIRFAYKLTPGNYTLHIAFIGTLNDELRGFYRSSFTDSDNNVHWMGVTQFESTDARRAFPCFDEPQLKAPFAITIQAPDSLEVLSNMGGQTKFHPSEGYKVVTFEKTPKMSTYLVAFIVGDLEAVTKKDHRQRPVSVWTVKGKSNFAKFAVDFTVKAVNAMEDYFDIPYALDKLDLVAIPDFSAGAMENWGLITFRETALLLSAHPTRREYSNVAGTIAHELVHQWTGDLVTCAWWSTLWLNEAFATFYETYFVNYLYPDWSSLDEYMSDQLAGMEYDGYPSTHPIVVPVISPYDSSDVFDEITYEKGASILLMISKYIDETVGPNTWRDGIRAYLKKYQFGNAFTEDLWDSVGTSAQIDHLSDLMLNWTSTPGYPIVTFSQSSDHYTVSQNRYYSLQNESISNDQKWWIPLNIIFPNSSIYTVPDTMAAASTELQVPRGKEKWYKANINQAGFYRVNYPVSNWLALKKVFSTLNPYDRAGLVSDASHLAFSGELNPVDAFNFLQVLTNETENVVWESALNQFYAFDDLISDLICHDEFLSYMKTLISPIATSVGFFDRANESHTEGLLRYNVLNAAVKFRAFSVQQRQKAIELFRCIFGFSTCPQYPSADAKLAIYRAGIQEGNYEAYYLVLDRYKAENDTSEKARLLAALGYPTDRALLLNTLQISLNSSIVRSQDRGRPVVYVSANPLGRELAWSFVQENWDALNMGGFGTSRLLAVPSHFSGDFWYNQFKEFFTKNPPSGAAKTLEITLERVKANGIWKDKYGDDVCKWLQANYPVSY